ncbi:sigma 54-interacting transcriptional regulator [Fundidesulfovibrio butyratiphilus]
MSHFCPGKTTCLLLDKKGRFLHVGENPDLDLAVVRKSVLELINKAGKVPASKVVRLGTATLEIHHLTHEGVSFFFCLLHEQTSPGEHWRIADLVQSNRELNDILETSHDAIVVADGKGIYLRITKNYEHITGIPPLEIIGRSTYEIVEDGLVSDSPTSTVVETGKVHSLSQTFRTGRVSHITASPLFDDKGELYRVVVNIRDTTELSKLRMALASSQEQLDQYSQIVSSLMQGQQDDPTFSSPAMRQLKSMAVKFSQVDSHLLIEGETGVGKEVIADLVHKHSPRKNDVFLKINCSAIPENLLESELFGYEPGAFTGANKDGRIGLLEMAHKGTVFLDEIGEIPLTLQAKLLRFIQQKEFYRVGGKKLRKVDVRIVAATNCSLEEMVRKKTFRSDLYYRLNVLKLVIPPLRKRPEDIIPLSQHFVDKFNERHKLSRQLSPEVLRGLLEYDWPGNVRELENLMERLIIISDKSLIGPEHLPECMTLRLQGKTPESHSAEMTYRQARDAFERRYWIRAMRKYGSCRRAAAALGVDHSTVVKKLTRYDISSELAESAAKDAKKARA